MPKKISLTIILICLLLIMLSPTAAAAVPEDIRQPDSPIGSRLSPAPLRLLSHSADKTQRKAQFDVCLLRLEKDKVIFFTQGYPRYTLNMTDDRIAGTDKLEQGCTVRLSCTARQGRIDVTSLEVIMPTYAQRRAEELCAALTLREKVGQMLFIRCPSDNSVGLLERVQPGGVILFAVNTAHESPDSLRGYLSQLQKSTNVPLLVGVDEEGGSVCRISCYQQYRPYRLGSPQALWRQGGMARIAAETADTAAILRELGFNVNFAPVADVSTDKKDFINARAFGGDAAATAEYVKTAVRAMQKQGIAAVLKHFPGYGNNSDTHTGVVEDKRSLSQFLSSDLLPFIAGMESGAELLLVSHNRVAAFDGSYPASLSPEVHRYLREELGYFGLIITDDLAMGGVTDLYSPEETAVLAVKAGNDLLLTSSAELQLNAIVAAVEDGSLDESLINTAVTRILRYKIEHNML